MTDTQARPRGGELPAAVVRLRAGVRLLVLGGVALGLVAVADHLLPWPLLTTTLGPTAFVFLTTPADEAATLRHAVIAHAVAIGCGLGALAAFGLWTHPPPSVTGHATVAQLGAAVVALAVTLLLLDVLDTRHPPAGATTLLVATGLAHPGKPLVGLALGLAIMVVVAPLLARVLPGWALRKG